MLGPPAVGKSTVVKAILAERQGIARFVVRHQLAEERANRTDLWEALRAAAEKGAWIPDSVVIEMLARKLRRYPSAELLLEGLPANGTQAAMVRDLLAATGPRTISVLYLDAPDEVCAARMRTRQVCPSCADGMAPACPDPASPDQCGSCGTPLMRRDDDTEASFAERLRLHRENIPGILAAFRPGEVIALDASQSPSSVAAMAAAALIRPSQSLRLPDLGQQPLRDRQSS